MLKHILAEIVKRYVLRGLQSDIDMLKTQIDITRSKQDIDDVQLEKFLIDRKSDIYNSVYEEINPLVSICIATYNRSSLLVNRSLASVIKQDYDNIEIIIVGDCCTDDTEYLVSRIGDPRVRFVNLPQRGEYPEEPMWRWMVAGTNAVNYALSMATGSFITHLDDDDEHSPDRIGKLVRFVQETRADLVWHPFRWETDRGKWASNEARHFRLGEVTTSSIFYHNWFKRIPWDINAYKYREPGDWNRLRKIQYLGARLARYPECLLTHYKERNQKK